MHQGTAISAQGCGAAYFDNRIMYLKQALPLSKGQIDAPAGVKQNLTKISGATPFRGDYQGIPADCRAAPHTGKSPDLASIESCPVGGMHALCNRPGCLNRVSQATCVGGRVRRFSQADAHDLVCTPAVTLHALFSRTLHVEKQRSCLAAVARAASPRTTTNRWFSFA